MRLKGTNIKKKIYTKKTIVIVNITFHQVSNNFMALFFFFFLCFMSFQHVLSA